MAKRSPMELAKNIKSNVDRLNAGVEKTVMTYVHAPMIVLALVVITFLAISFNYIRKLEETGCECSKDWKRDYIFWYLVIAITFWIINILVLALGDGWGVMSSVVMITFRVLFTLATVAFVVISLIYVNHLKTEKCKCSESAGRVVLQIVSWYHVVIWGFALLSLIMMALFSVDLMKNVLRS